MVGSPAYNKRIEQEQSKELINRETQEINNDQTEFFVVVEQMPVLIGGMGNLQKQVKYPETARQAGIEGRVIVQFIVSETGLVINPKVIRGIGGGCDEAAIEAVKKVTFEPGSQRGVPVPVQFSLPIVFRLQD